MILIGEKDFGVDFLNKRVLKCVEDDEMRMEKDYLKENYVFRRSWGA